MDADSDRNASFSEEPIPAPKSEADSAHERPRKINKDRMRYVVIDCLDARKSRRELAEEICENPMESQDTNGDRRLADIGAAVDNLPVLERNVLRDFLVTKDKVQALATRHRLTIYLFRETLVNALGRVMTAVGEKTLPNTDEGNVALALWRDGRTVPEAAKVLGIPTREIRVIRRRLVHGALKRLRSLPPSCAQNNKEWS